MASERLASDDQLDRAGALHPGALGGLAYLAAVAVMRLHRERRRAVRQTSTAPPRT